MPLSKQGCIPKLPSCRSFSIAGRPTLENEAFREHPDVELDFVFEFTAGPLLTEEPPNPRHEYANPDGHVISPVRAEGCVQ